MSSFYMSIHRASKVFVQRGSRSLRPGSRKHFPLSVSTTLSLADGLQLTTRGDCAMHCRSGRPERRLHRDSNLHVELHRGGVRALAALPVLLLVLPHAALPAQPRRAAPPTGRAAGSAGGDRGVLQRLPGHRLVLGAAAGDFCLQCLLKALWSYYCTL